jgi:hypothetical protein
LQYQFINKIKIKIKERKKKIVSLTMLHRDVNNNVDLEGVACGLEASPVSPSDYRPTTKPGNPSSRACFL